MNPRLFAGRRVMWLPLDLAYRQAVGSSHCCAAMDSAVEFTCDQHADPFECPDALIVHHEAFGEYGIAVHDGGPSYVLIAFCPWCGASLGESQRDRWFETLETLGISDPDTANVPPEYLTAAWRHARPLAAKET